MPFVCRQDNQWVMEKLACELHSKSSLETEFVRVRLVPRDFFGTGQTFLFQAAIHITNSQLSSPSEGAETTCFNAVMPAISIPGYAIELHAYGKTLTTFLTHAWDRRRGATRVDLEVRYGFQKQSLWPPLWPVITGMMLLMDESNAVTA